MQKNIVMDFTIADPNEVESVLMPKELALMLLHFWNNNATKADLAQIVELHNTEMRKAQTIVEATQICNKFYVTYSVLNNVAHDKMDKYNVKTEEEVPLGDLMPNVQEAKVYNH
jgi:hypothetical protein